MDCFFRVYFDLFIEISKFVLIRDDIQKEAQKLKWELQRKVEEKEEKAEIKSEVAKNEAIEAYKQEQEKYKQLKSQMPEKGKGIMAKYAFLHAMQISFILMCSNVPDQIIGLGCCQ